MFQIPLPPVRVYTFIAFVVLILGTVALLLAILPKELRRKMTSKLAKSSRRVEWKLDECITHDPNLGEELRKLDQEWQARDRPQVFSLQPNPPQEPQVDSEPTKP